MILPLTLRLIVWPEKGWTELVSACESGDGLPAASLHGALAGIVSVVSTLIGSSFLPSATVPRVVAQTLAAAAGYVGAVVVATSLPPKMLGVSDDDVDLVPRFAASACLPTALGGFFNFVPLVGLTLVWILAGAVLTYRSALIGAETLLRLPAETQRRAASTLVFATSVPVLITTAFRFAINQ